MNDPQPIAMPAAPARLDLSPIPPASGKDVAAASIEARQIGAERALQELRQQTWPAAGTTQAVLDRCEALLERSRAAAAGGSSFVALDCLMQFERECIALISPEQRRACSDRFLASAIGPRRPRDQPLWSIALQRADLSDVATAQALFDAWHQTWRAQMLAVQGRQQQLRKNAPLVVASVLFYVCWALLGGFDWLARDDIDVTTGMLMVAGAMSGWLGAVVGLAFNTRIDDWEPGTEPGAQRWLGLSRAALGAIVAVPIVLLIEAGLIDLTQLPAALVLLVCFVVALATDRAWLRSLRVTRASD